MAISHKHKLIFIHIPKNAGTSIKESLGISLWGHEDWTQLKAKYGEAWENYTKFAVVRNPWDRAVSCYEYSKMEESFWHTRNKKKVEGRKLRVHPDYNAIKNRTFLETLKLLKEGGLRSQHWTPQHSYITDDSNRVVVDRIFKVENLLKEWNNFTKDKGISCSLKFLNPSSRKKDYRLYYCDESREIVEQYYKKDIALFEYKF